MVRTAALLNVVVLLVENLGRRFSCEILPPLMRLRLTASVIMLLAVMLRLAHTAALLHSAREYRPDRAHVVTTFLPWLGRHMRTANHFA